MDYSKQLSAAYGYKLNETISDRLDKTYRQFRSSFDGNTLKQLFWLTKKAGKRLILDHPLGPMRIGDVTQDAAKVADRMSPFSTDRYAVLPPNTIFVGIAVSSRVTVYYTLREIERNRLQITLED